MNSTRTSLAGLTSIPVLACALLACGSNGVDNADAGGEDATSNTSDHDATADGGGIGDSGQSKGLDAGEGGAPDTSVDASHGDAGDSGFDASQADANDSGLDAGVESGDAAGALGCDGGAPLPPDAGLPPVHICSFADGSADFPLFDKCCVSSDDCAIGVYEFSCCGDTLALGFNKSQSSAFQAIVPQWTCAACGCAGRGMHTEDGEGGVVDAGVTCDRGWCMTYAR
jgi:hypothetical protein